MDLLGVGQRKAVLIQARPHPLAVAAWPARDSIFGAPTVAVAPDLTERRTPAAAPGRARRKCSDATQRALDCVFDRLITFAA